MYATYGFFLHPASMVKVFHPIALVPIPAPSGPLVFCPPDMIASLLLQHTSSW